jgi:hypothetical protein
MALTLAKKGTDYFCIVLQGNALSGKTTLAGKQDRPLFLSTDGKAARQGYDAIIFDSVQIIKDLPEFVRSNNYKTIVFDVVDELEEIVEAGVRAKHNSPVITDEMQQEVDQWYKAVIKNLVENYNVVFISRTASTKKEKMVANVTSRGLGYVLGRSTAVLHISDSHEVTIEGCMSDIMANHNFKLDGTGASWSDFKSSEGDLS